MNSAHHCRYIFLFTFCLFWLISTIRTQSTLSCVVTAASKQGLAFYHEPAQSHRQWVRSQPFSRSFIRINTYHHDWYSVHHMATFSSLIRHHPSPSWPVQLQFFTHLFFFFGDFITPSASRLIVIQHSGAACGRNVSLQILVASHSICLTVWV